MQDTKKKKNQWQVSHLIENKSTEKRLKRLLTRVLFSYKQTAACVSIKALMFQEPENPVDADAASFATLCVSPQGSHLER